MVPVPELHYGYLVEVDAIAVLEPDPHGDPGRPPRQQRRGAGPVCRRTLGSCAPAFAGDVLALSASDQKSGAILRASLHDVFPELRAARIDYCWGGMVDMARDRLPRAGERNGIYYSMGYSGHGTQMSTLMGTIMAEVMDGRAELNPWKDFAWPAIPGHLGRPWFLPLVGAYYRLKDKLA